jgi:phage gp36-like protein
MECNKPKNLKKCNCSYEPCQRKGTCCECIQYHLRMQELPACCFPDDIEQTFDRSFSTFAQAVMSGKIHN